MEELKRVDEVKKDDEDKDVIVTDERELRAWYGYDWATSVYNNIALTMFLPIFLLRLAQADAGCLDDEYEAAREARGDDDDKCDLYATSGGLRMRPASFAFNVISISVFFQAISFITVSPLADHGNMRKQFFMFYVVCGSCFTMLFITVVEPDLWLYAGALTILSNVCYGSAIVFYNAYLPLLVRGHPEYLACPPEDRVECKERLSNLISTRGFIAGYAGPMLLLIICVIILLMDASFQGLRIVLFLAGFWWLIFSIPTFLYLKQRPGEPFPENTSRLTFGWKRVYRTIREARQIPTTFRFLISYMIYSDGFNTVASIGVLFGSEELGMEMKELLILAMIIPISAAAGNFFFHNLQKKKGYTSKKMIYIHLTTFLCLPIYAIIGFVAPFGLVSVPELLLFGFVFGFNVGSVQSYSRSLFAELIPPGMESEFFGLYEITDKGSSWIGPLLVGVILEGGLLSFFS
eukprot:TRINITY_DN1317_c0_g1_i1.p1 TRINITY_DN1317_c0_g1~~TRINITY_DN1317_c0_g1_i1.p1  ORF type:complete len:463 (+),score=104.06 TRINITY_DN1317_c0_g1_i1:187-1575(+)